MAVTPGQRLMRPKQLLRGQRVGVVNYNRLSNHGKTVALAWSVCIALQGFSLLCWEPNTFKGPVTASGLWTWWCRRWNATEIAEPLNHPRALISCWSIITLLENCCGTRWYRSHAPRTKISKHNILHVGSTHHHGGCGERPSRMRQYCVCCKPCISPTVQIGRASLPSCSPVLNHRFCRVGVGLRHLLRMGDASILFRT